MECSCENSCNIPDPAALCSSVTLCVLAACEYEHSVSRDGVVRLLSPLFVVVCFVCLLLCVGSRSAQYYPFGICTECFLLEH